MNRVSFCIVVLMALGGLLSCKKSSSSPSIAGKWAIADDSTQFAGSGNNPSYHSDYIGQPGDYYDFSPRNMLYTKEGAHTDSMAHEVLPNNQVRCSPSPGFNESYTTSDIALNRATFHVMLITEQGTLTKIILLTR